jgi:hypothetical protein
LHNWHTGCDDNVDSRKLTDTAAKLVTNLDAEMSRMVDFMKSIFPRASMEYFQPRLGHDNVVWQDFWFGCLRLNLLNSQYTVGVDKFCWGILPIPHLSRD